MTTTPSRSKEQDETWPRKVQPGREVVRVYRRRTPSGNYAYMVSNFSDGKRKFDCYATEIEALEAAETLAKRIDRRDFVAASINREQAVEYVDSATALKPFGVSVRAACATVAECLKVAGDLSNLHAAVKLYTARHRAVTKKPVPDVVAELLKVKEARHASERYMADLTGRLNRFAECCTKHACTVSTTDLQNWLDGLKLSPQSYRNYKAVLHLLFKFAVARGYAHDNPVEGVERIKVRNGDVQVYSPSEMARLLEAARTRSPDFLPILAVAAFSGLRSAELERLEWSDIHLAERFIVVGASKSKTASRRLAFVPDNLAQWLAPYANRQGKVWPRGHQAFYKCQQQIAAATAVEADEQNGIKAMKPVEWQANAARHSYASYRFAQTGDAGRVAGELGNSAGVVHKHYKQLVQPLDAERWFSLKPESPPNVIDLPAVAAK